MDIIGGGHGPPQPKGAGPYLITTLEEEMGDKQKDLIKLFPPIITAYNLRVKRWGTF